MERNEKKKRVSADIPFSFLNELGHNTRAMERFFDLPRETQETLTDAVSIAEKRPYGRFSAFCSVFPLILPD